MLFFNNLATLKCVSWLTDFCFGFFSFVSNKTPIIIRNSCDIPIRINVSVVNYMNINLYNQYDIKSENCITT